MKPARAILLASHGTPGARAAEAAAFDLCAQEGRVHHLVVVPDFWKGMLGDDWLNNAAVLSGLDVMSRTNSSAKSPNMRR
jgi:hypothetical protein